jgi:ribosome maturation factor RimP
VGHDAKIELDPPVDGRKRVQGPIAATSDSHVTLTVDAGPFPLPFAAVKRAKLVLTDRLIAEALQAEAQAEASEEFVEGAQSQPRLQS